MTHKPEHTFTTRERLLFSLSFGALPLLLTWVATRRAEGLLLGAALMGLAWLSSLTFNRETTRAAQWPGGIYPLVFLLFWTASRIPHALSALASLGVGAALLLAAWPQGGARVAGFYRRASVPVAWGISMAAMAVAFYLVLTPLALLMRLVGHDPMKRAWDRREESYWTPHESPSDAERYFRQF